MKTILKSVFLGLVAASLMGCCVSQGLHDDDRFVRLTADLPGEMLPIHDSSSATHQRLCPHSPTPFPADKEELGSLPPKHEDWNHPSHNRLPRELADSHGDSHIGGWVISTLIHMMMYSKIAPD